MGHPYRAIELIPYDLTQRLMVIPYIMAENLVVVPYMVIHHESFGERLIWWNGKGHLYRAIQPITYIKEKRRWSFNSVRRNGSSPFPML